MSENSMSVGKNIQRLPVVSVGLRRLLTVVFLLFALLAVNSTYLASITLLEHFTAQTHQDYFYLTMFLAHLVLGLALVVPFLVFGLSHLRRAIRRRNRNAVRAGLGLFAAGLLLLLSGVLLTRFGFFEINDPTVRQVSYWTHVIAPLVVTWLFVLHRLAGSRISWRTGARWAGVAAGFAGVMVAWHASGMGLDKVVAEPAFVTTMIRTPGGRTMAAEAFMTDEFCAECHTDIAKGWEMSSHRLSSFNNPFYSFSVQETRKVSMDSRGTVEKSQFCGGCHDIVPMVSGKFDDPQFDVVNDPTAHAGLTCTSCHAITAVNSVLGNADFTIEPPVSYPFERSPNSLLHAVGKQLIKAKPAYHKAGFLKPAHTQAEFCATCHKAHMPVSVNDYKWLRGQNHYDSFKQSGVPGHRVDSFYYPTKAIEKCAACHMPLQPSDDPAARDFDGSGVRSVHSHFFPAANTGLAHAVKLPEEAIAAHRRMLEGAVRVDIFGVREAGVIDGELHAPLDKVQALLEPGKKYLVEAVVRNLRVGHHLTQGTADSNELWVDISLKAGDTVIGRSGGMDTDGRVDPWSFFINAYVLTKDGARLDRRNGQDTFVALYNHQIPPGAAAVVHYLVEIPAVVSGPLSIEAAVKYRKFDTTYLQYVQGDEFKGNDLPVVTLASDVVHLGDGVQATAKTKPDEWERWNDYGIGLLLAGEAKQSALRQAELAFQRVEALGRPDGPLNLARVYLKEGRVDEAAAALQRAADRHAQFRPWARAWLTALVDRENGHLDGAIDTLRALLDTRFAAARERGFDFGKDYRARAMLGRVLYERARLERGQQRRARRDDFLEQARDEFERVLTQDPEYLAAHFNLALIYADLGDAERAERHRARQLEYRPDDHAIEQAVAVHRRRNPAADHAAEPVAVYDLQRSGAYELPLPSDVAATRALKVTTTPEHSNGQQG